MYWSASNVGRAGFELERQVVVRGFLEGDGADHVAAALVGRHGLKQRSLAVEHADAGGPVDLVAAECVEVAVEGLHIDGEVGHGLRAIDEDGNAHAMREIDHFADRGHRAQRIRNLGDGDEFGARADQPGKFFEFKLAAVVDGRNAEMRAFFLAQNLPRHNVGVMLHGRDENFIAGADMGAAVALRHEIDGLGGAADEDDLARVGSVEEAAHGFARRLGRLIADRRRKTDEQSASAIHRLPGSKSETQKVEALF